MGSHVERASVSGLASEREIPTIHLFTSRTCEGNGQFAGVLRADVQLQPLATTFALDRSKATTAGAP